jgi:hypothetical protein
MTADREVTRFVREWLEDGADVLPDRVLDSVLDQLPVTPQRRHWWQAWRNPFAMNTMKLALAASVVVFATFVGLGLYFNQGDVIGPEPTQPPNPTVSPTIIPDPTASPPTPVAGLPGGTVPAGTYVTDTLFPLQIEFTVPEGWQSWRVARDGVGVSKHGGEAPAGSGFGFWIVGEVYPDPCNRFTVGREDPGPSVDDLVAALERLENYETTTPTDVSLGGYSGKYLEITAPADLSSCADPRLWRTQAGGDRSVFGPEEHDRIWILDVEGTRLLVKIAYRPGTPDSDVAELEQMVESIRIRPPEASTPSPTAIPIIPVGNVPAGTYVTDTSFPLQVEFTVPEGWEYWRVTRDGVGVSKDDGERLPAGFGFWIVSEIFPDPCNRYTIGPVDPGPSVDDLASALQSLENYETTTPTDVSLGGYSGQYLEITAPADFSDCAGPQLWWTEDGRGRSVFGPEEHDRIWILDVEGTRLLVTIAYRPGTPDSDVAELEQMVESIRIRPPEAPTPTAEAPSSSPMSFSRLGGIAGVDVPAGTYVTDLSFPLQIQFTVPEGWQRWTAGSDATGVDRHGGEPPLGSRFGFWSIDEISQDPCDPARGAVDPGPKAEDLAGALQEIENWSTTNPVDVSLGGFSGKYLELTAPNDLPQCLDFRGLETATFLGHSIGPGSRWLIWILDVNDTRLVVAASYRPATPELDVTELQQMVDSIVIQP